VQCLTFEVGVDDCAGPNGQAGGNLGSDVDGRFASSRTESGRMAFGSALGRLARRKNRRRRPWTAGRDAGGRSASGVTAAPGKRSSCASSFRSPNSRAPTSARKSHLSVITVRRTWAGPFPSLRRRPNIRSPSSFPNRTAASSSFSPKRGRRRRRPRYFNPGEPVTGTPAAGRP
jgi:hypothetical protein